VIDEAALHERIMALGQVLSGPVPAYLGSETRPPSAAARLHTIHMLMHGVRTEPIPTYTVKVESGWVWVAV
jgi:hypothetical protein